MTRLSFAFGGEGNAKTAEELARERLLVEALMGRQPAPKNLGEGLSALGEAIGYRMANKRLQQDEGAARSAGDALYEKLSLFGGTKAIGGPNADQPASYNTDPVGPPQAAPTFGDKFTESMIGQPDAPVAQPAPFRNGVDMTQAQPVPQPMPQQVAQAQPDNATLISQYERVLADPNFQHVDPQRQKMVQSRYEKLLEIQQQAQDPVRQLTLQKLQQEVAQGLRKKPIEVGGRLVDPDTYKVLYEDKPAPKAPEPYTLSPGQERHNPDGTVQASLPKPIDTTMEDEAQQISDAIISGDQPPDLTGLYKQGSHVRAALARKGYNLTDAKEDWAAQQKYIATLNGPQQVRLRQAVDFAFHSLPIIKGLAQEWKAGKYPPLNSVQLEAAKQGALGQDAQRIATQLSSQIADMTSELGTVYKGGNSSTDESLRLAGENLKANWSEETLLAGIELVGKNLQIRRNSINSGSPMGAGTRYQQAPAPYVAPPVETQDGADPLEQAREAIAKGADPAKVRQRLIDNGIDPSGL